MEKATFAGGCFWCTEAIFKRIKGVGSVISGYSNNAESIRILFDPKVISYAKLVYIFFRVHDPTTLNKQGHDLGTQYRSIIFYHTDQQKKAAQKEKINAQKIYKDPIVTEIIPFESFHEAEDHDQDYYKNNSNKPYCKLVIDPKIQKLQKNFKEYLK